MVKIRQKNNEEITKQTNVGIKRTKRVRNNTPFNRHFTNTVVSIHDILNVKIFATVSI